MRKKIVKQSNSSCLHDTRSKYMFPILIFFGSNLIKMQLQIFLGFHIWSKIKTKNLAHKSNLNENKSEKKKEKKSNGLQKKKTPLDPATGPTVFALWPEIFWELLSEVKTVF